MKILMFMWLLDISGGDIGAINQQIRIAQAAQAKGDYQTAVQAYRILVHKLKHSPDEIILNYAHCFYKLGQKDSAANYYNRLITATSATATIARQQLGNIAAEKQDINGALEHFKNALRADYTNEEARYNYEALKRQKEQQDKNQQQKDKQNQQQDKEQQQNQSQKDKSQNQDDKKQSDQNQQQNGEKQPEKQGQQPQQQQKGEVKDEPAKPNEQQRYQQIQITPEQAKMIMDALRSNEIKYHQQMQKKPKSKPDRSKPDW